MLLYTVRIHRFMLKRMTKHELTTLFTMFFFMLKKYVQYIQRTELTITWTKDKQQLWGYSIVERKGIGKFSRNWKSSGGRWLGMQNRHRLLLGLHTAPPRPLKKAKKTNSETLHAHKKSTPTQLKHLKDTYFFREVFLNQVKCRFVDQLVLMSLQSLDLVQSTAFFDHQTQLVCLSDFIPSLMRKHITISKPSCHL